MGVKRIREIIDSLKGPTVLAIDDPYGVGRSRLANELKRGWGLLKPSDILVFREEDMRVRDFDEADHMGLAGRFSMALWSGKGLVVYDGDCLMDGLNGFMGIRERLENELARFNIVRAGVGLVYDGDGGSYTVHGRFMDPKLLAEPAIHAMRVASFKQFLRIGPGALIQRAPEA